MGMYVGHVSFRQIEKNGAATRNHGELARCIYARRDVKRSAEGYVARHLARRPAASTEALYRAASGTKKWETRDAAEMHANVSDFMVSRMKALIAIAPRSGQAGG